MDKDQDDKYKQYKQDINIELDSCRQISKPATHVNNIGDGINFDALEQVVTALIESNEKLKNSIKKRCVGNDEQGNTN